MNEDTLAQMIDHTNLHADITLEAVEKLCTEARDNHFKMVAINPAQVVLCKKLLKDTDVHVGAAIGFPLGQETLETKAFSTKDAIGKGADEIDYVINIHELKQKNYEYLTKEMQTIVDICRENNVISKVIFENCYLTKEEIAKLCEISLSVKFVFNNLTKCFFAFFSFKFFCLILLSFLFLLLLFLFSFKLIGYISTSNIFPEYILFSL